MTVVDLVKRITAAGASAEVVAIVVEAVDGMCPKLKTSIPTKLYLVECLTYGNKHPIKVGITRDLKQRLRALPSVGITCPRLLGYFQFPDEQSARDVERETLNRFPRNTDIGFQSREILQASRRELLAFIAPLAPSKFVRPSR